jgi:hypothetical protein
MWKASGTCWEMINLFMLKIFVEWTIILKQAFRFGFMANQDIANVEIAKIQYYLEMQLQSRDIIIQSKSEFRRSTSELLLLLFLVVTMFH